MLLITVLAINESAGAFPLLKKCTDYLGDEIRALQKAVPEEFKIGENSYAKFDKKGELLCYEWIDAPFFEEVQCTCSYDIVRLNHLNDDYKSFIFGLHYCYNLLIKLLKGYDVDSACNNYRGLVIGNEEYIFCFTQTDTKKVLLYKDCPSSFKEYRINPKNFVFLFNGLRTYYPPTISQYEHLVSIKHVSVADADDYDHEHWNDYSND